MKSHDRRWNTPFGSFVSSYGAARLRRDLATMGHALHPTTIYSWLAGATAPGPERTIAIVGLGRGRISAEDVLRHRQEVRHGDGNRPREVAHGAPARHRR